MKTYYGYVRVSTTEQGKGASLDEQRAAILAFAARANLTISDWFVETTTAAKAGRREFSRMLASLAGGKAAGVIIHKIDRSARNLADWARIGELVDQGVEVLFAHDGLDITTRGGRLTADLLAVIASDFIRNNREEVRKGRRGALKRGLYPGSAPKGYENHGRHALKTIHPTVGPLVARAFELYATGTHSLDSLRHSLATEGLTRRNGLPLGKETMSCILRNPFYMGIIRIKGETFEGAHQPLITPSLFDRVQRLMDGRVFANATRHEFRFRRLIQCATCPRTLTGERQKGHVYYRCHACHGTSLPERAINNAVEGMLALAFDEGEMRDIGDIIRDLMKDDLEAEARRRSSADQALANIAERLSRLTDALVDGLLDKEAFNERKAGLLAERARAQERSIDSATDLFWHRVLKRFELWKTAQDGYAVATDAEKRALLLSLGSNFTARGKELLFTADFAITDTLKWRGVSAGANAPGHIRIDNLPQAALTSKRPISDIERFIKTLDRHQPVPETPACAPRRIVPPQRNNQAGPT
jgi:DNA invertase Pin-like site-specific DNA recombinase